MKNLKMTIASLAAIALMALAPIVTARAASTTVNAASVLNTYAKIAHATYTDSLVTAEALKQAVGALVAGPTATNLETARAAWRRTVTQIRCGVHSAQARFVRAPAQAKSE